MEKTEIQVTFNEKALIAFSKFVRKTHVKTFFGNIGLFLTLSFVGFCLGIVGFIFSINYSFILQLLSIALLLVGGFYFFNSKDPSGHFFPFFPPLIRSVRAAPKAAPMPAATIAAFSGFFLA